MFFFFISSIISYKIVTNDPPVVVAYKNGLEVAGNLAQLAKANKDNLKIFLISSAVRRNTLKNLTYPICGQLTKENTYVFPYYPEFPDLLTQYSDKVNATESFTDACSLIDTASLFLVAENVAKDSNKAGYSNPFTPGVWNCFFFVIFTIAFIIWSMIHFSNIDVQTKFAKKLY